MFGTKMRRGMAFVAILAVLLMPFGLAPANAEPDYPPSFYKISADSYSTTIGGTLRFTAQTFRSGSQVTVDVTADGAPAAKTATVTANGDGVAKASVTFTVEGINTVTMAGTADDGRPLSLAADITVTADDVIPIDDGNDGGGSDSAGGVPILGGGLPRTGGEIVGTALVAAALIGLGALLVVFTRRRRTS